MAVKTPPPPPPPVLWPAVAAAIIDEDRAEWVPPLGVASRPHECFTRAHLALLRDCGATRTQVLDYAAQFLNRREVAKLQEVLPEFGW